MGGRLGTFLGHDWEVFVAILRLFWMVVRMLLEEYNLNQTTKTSENTIKCKNNEFEKPNPKQKA